jgi:hypothetical protein
MKHKDPLLSLINSSGFVFQIGVRREIERTAQQHGWEVMVEEHRWTHPTIDDSGFIDLVLKHSRLESVRLVVECKRATNRDWVFLRPREYSRNTSIMSAFWTNRKEKDKDVWGWFDVEVNPPSTEASFCVVKGQDDKKTPMIERIADSLLPSVEALAIQEMSLQPYKNAIGKSAIYLPIIITNARLSIASFDAENVSMKSGKLEDSKFAEFKEVSKVRFRKTLATHMFSTRVPQDLIHANIYSQVSILIVNSSSFADVFSIFNLPRNIGSALSSLIQTERSRKYGV